MTGPVLEPFTALTSLQTLSLRNNVVSGTIPEKFAAMSDLASLDLSTNYLSGSIPSAMSELVNLVHVDLSSNERLQGSADFLCNSGETNIIVECARVACSCCECGD